MIDLRMLKATLIELGITQLEASEVLGISREAFNRKINGGINFTLEEAFKLSEFTNRTVEDIFLPREFTQSKYIARGDGKQ